MSLDGFIIPAPEHQEEAGLDDFLSAPATPSKTEVKDDLSDLGDLPSIEEPAPVREEPQPTPEPEPIVSSVPVLPPTPEPVVPPAPVMPPTPEPAISPAPVLPPTPETETSIKSEEETVTTTIPIIESTPNPIPELTPTPPPPLPDLDITPPPKFEPAPELSSQPIITESPPPVENSITPAPVPQSRISVPAMVTPNTSGWSSSPLPPKPSDIIALQKIDKPKSDDEKIPDPKGPSDVWHNLKIDVRASSSNEDIALSLAQANDHLKRFVKFDKVLFKILKLAGGYRRKGTIGKPNDEEKEDIVKEIENWKIEFRIR